jgi:hypothetical protein
MIMEENRFNRLTLPISSEACKLNGAQLMPDASMELGTIG